jgi:hypothetical protein
MTELCTTTNKLEHQKRTNLRLRQKKEWLVAIEGRVKERCWKTRTRPCLKGCVTHLLNCGVEVAGHRKRNGKVVLKDWVAAVEMRILGHMPICS